ncbi:MAG: cytochrome C oxidase subunit IV family protein [Gemmatimonadales bacterium]
MADSSAAHTEGHSHPGWQMYVTIAIILFALTAMEVGAYEVAERGISGAFGTFVSQMVVEILLVLSAAKFALVAMFYMHLKQDSKVFSGLFVFPILIAAVIILALLALFVYNRSENAFWGLPPWS